MAATLFGCSAETDVDLTAMNSDDYVFDTDYQYYVQDVSTSPVARAENGYYYIDTGNSLLKYFDTEKMAATVVCDQANCEHNDSSCSAYLDSHYSKVFLSYYNGSLIVEYVERKNGVQTHYACQISLDGKRRTKKCMLFKSTGSASYQFSVHRGYVYLFRYLAGETPAEETVKIYKIPLDSKNKNMQDTQEIFTFTGLDISLSSFEIYGNHLYFELSAYDESAENANSNGYSDIVYDYDITENSFSTVELENYQYGFKVNNRSLVYYDKKEKHYNIYDLDQKTIANTADINDIGYISFDGENYYIDTMQAVNLGLTNDRKIYIVSTDGSILKSMSISSDYECLFGYNDILLFTQYVSIDFYYDKTQNGSDKADLIII